MPGKKLSETKSLCPECIEILPAEIFEHENKIWIKKHCKKHGEFVDLYWGDAESYHRVLKYAHEGKGIKNPNVNISNPVCPKACGLCSLHKTHTALGNVVVTNHCNLTCFYCLPFDEELIIKFDGNVFLKKIGELVEESFSSLEIFPIQEGEYSEPKGIEVLTFKNGKCKWTKVKKLFRRPFNGQCKEIITKTGRRIKTTDDHNFLVLDKDQLVRKKANELKRNDKLLSLWNIPFQNKGMDELDLFDAFRTLPEIEKNRIYVRNIKDYINELTSHPYNLKNVFNDGGIITPSIYNWQIRDSMPLSVFYHIAKSNPSQNIMLGLDPVKHVLPIKLKITPELAKLIGYFISNGYYTKHSLSITTEDPKKREEIEECLKKINIKYSVSKLRRSKTCQITIENRMLLLVFKHVFNIPLMSYNKRLPQRVFNFSEKMKIALLSGLFNGNGFVIRGKEQCSIGITTVSKGLARDINYLLASLGIFSRIYFKEKQKKKGDTLYQLYISGQDMIKLVSLLRIKVENLKKVKGFSKRKEVKINKIGDFIVDEVKQVTSSFASEYVYDLEVEDDIHAFVGGDGILISNCFFYAKAMGYVYEPTLEQIRMMFRIMRQEKPIGAKAIQLTGGEPLLREDIVDIVKIAKEEGFSHVQLNTNGIRLAFEPKLLERLYNAGVNTLYLSFDGVTPHTNPKNHYEIPRVFYNTRMINAEREKHGLPGRGIVLVPTVINTVNDFEVGDILRFGLRHIDVVRSVNYQPVSLVGRITRADVKKYRITIPDVIKRLADQTGIVEKNDFFPIPSVTSISHFIEEILGAPKYELTTHSVCGMATYLFLDGDKPVPITRFVDVDGLLEYLQARSEEIKKGGIKLLEGIKVLAKLNSFIDKKKQPKDLNFGKIIFNILTKGNYQALRAMHHKTLFIGMMHFMDLWNYDIQRVERCCIHYAQPDGRVVPFCAFNVIPQWYRDKIQEQFSISIDEWEKRTGKKLEHMLYHRDAEKLASEHVYKEVYEGFVK